MADPSSDENRGTDDEVVCSTFLLKRPSPDGDDVVIVDSIVIEDHGTGLGADVAEALGCRGTTGAEAGTEIDGETIRITFAPTDHEGWIEVHGTGGWHQPLWPRTTTTLLMLRFLTGRRLDDPAEPPRLHASAAADEAGRAVVLLGRSGAGKSTVVTHLLDQGLDLVSDEQVSFDARRHRLTAFTRPIEIEEGGDAHLPERVRRGAAEAGATHISPETFGRQHRLVATPAAIVLLERSEAEIEAYFEPVEPAAAVEALCSNNLDLERDPITGLEAFAALASTVPTMRLRFSSSAEGAVMIGDLLASGLAPLDHPWSVTAHDPTSVPTARNGFVLAPDVIHVRIGDGAVLYHQRSRLVARLNCDGARLITELPALPEGEAVSEFVDHLLAPGFLVRASDLDDA